MMCLYELPKVEDSSVIAFLSCCSGERRCDMIKVMMVLRAESWDSGIWVG
jgi:hypothetical protein